MLRTRPRKPTARRYKYIQLLPLMLQSLQSSKLLDTKNKPRREMLTLCVINHELQTRQLRVARPMEWSTLSCLWLRWRSRP